MLTQAQKNSVKLYAGYPVVTVINVSEMPVAVVSFDEKLNLLLDTLSPEVEEMLVSDMLPSLDTLRKDIFNVRENSDTQQAAVWTRNADELAEREALYRRARIELCDFLNIGYGSALAVITGKRSLRVVRG